MKNLRKTFVLVLVLLLLLMSVGVAYAYGNADFQVVTDLDGKRVGVQTAVLYEEMIAEDCPNATISYFTMPNDMIFALKANKIDAYLIEQVSYGVQKKNHPELDVLEEPAGEFSGTIILGDNEKKDKLLGELNQFISDSKEDGMLDEIYEDWILDFDPDTDSCDLGNFTGENGVIKVAIEGGYEPFSFMTEGGVLSGFDVDFVCRFCRAYGYEPEFYSVPFEAIAPGVETGKYDIGMNIVVSEERNENGTLTDAYYTSPVLLVVLGEDESNVGFIGQIKNSFYKTFIKENRWQQFLSGTGETILITVAAIIFGTILGFIAYMIFRKENFIANKIIDFIIWLIHGTPTVVLLMILYYIVFGSTSLSGLSVSIVGFTLIFACAMFDMLKVGYNAIGRGQVEASRALGYSDRESFFKILLPQAARHFLPIYRSEVVTLIKETAIVGYIAVMDLTKISDLVRSRTYEAFFPLIATAIIYFIIAGIMTTVVKRVDISIDPKRRSKDKILKDIVEQE